MPLDSIMPTGDEDFGGDSLLSPVQPAAQSPALGQPAAVPAPFGPDDDNVRELGDAVRMRNNIYNQVLTATQNMQPVSNTRHTLRIADVGYQDPDVISKRDQKMAILNNMSQGRRLQGTWELVDNTTGSVVDKKRSVIMTVPHATERGTFINNGTEYTLKNQQRLLSGVFTRLKDNGEVESHVNVMPGKGASHRYFLDPERGVFKINVGQGTVGMMPLLKALGATGQQIKEAWGPDLYASNFNSDSPREWTKLKSKFLTPKELEADELTQRATLKNKFESMELNPEVTRQTLGHPHKGLTLDALLDISKKLIRVSRKEEEPDDRDALPYQQFFGPEDLMAERISRDKGNLRRKLLWKASARGNLKAMPSSVLSKQLNAAIMSSGLGQAVEEINPAELLDKMTAVSRLGEGGISGTTAIPKESRSVQPSMFGYVDPVRTPESGKVGVDTYFASGARKGRDGKLYAKFNDARTGESVFKTPQEVNKLTIGFPGSMSKASPYVAAMRGGRTIYTMKDKLDLVLPNMEAAFNPLSNMIPAKGMVKGQRLVMATRMTTQALPIVGAEAPLVQSAVPGSNGSQSYESMYASSMGTLRSKKPGVVTSVSEDEIEIQHDDGTKEKHELYNNFPFNRKTFLHQTSLVQPGQRVDPDSLLAHSNFTDKSGAAALGRNARTAYVSWQGKNFEDAVVISEGFARKMSSEHMYQHDVDTTNGISVGKKSYISLFPGKFDRKTLEKIDDSGVIKVRSTVEYGDPLILCSSKRETAHNRVHKKGQSGHSDSTITWDHHDPGIVTDVVQGKNGPSVVVKTQSACQVGDKLSGRYGDKGVIADIIPDHQMPHDNDRQPYEVLLNPLGIITRSNPAQMAELYLGKIAAKRGTPIALEDFDDSKDMTEWVLQELAKEGMSDLDDIVDPSKDRKIRDIATGNRFFMKLHHTAEGKGQSRGGGSYTMDGTPAKGGESGSKRIGMLESNALLAHGATDTLQDIKSVRGQQNDDYWLQYMAGYNPTTTKVPQVYTKFVNTLKAAGVNVVKNGSQTNIMAMTDKDVNDLAGDRDLNSSEGVNWDEDLKEISGGLFDKAKTGGHGGNRWSAIRLTEPMPNPVMEEPLRHILGLTGKQFQGVLSGEHTLGNHGTGPAGMKKALESIDIDKAIERARAVIASGRKSDRDSAVRRLGYLKSAKKLGLHPSDYMMSRVPVLPPAFRPVSLMSNDMPLVDDSNHLYKELFEANANLAEIQKELGAEASGKERLATYQAFKAVTGLGDPLSQKLQEKNVHGLLKSVFGASPKFSTLQRKLISATVDNVGRAVITPDPNLDMDSVGLPEDKAFRAYEKFIVRRLSRQGMSVRRALEAVRERSPLARKTLLEEMDKRPVYISRAPVLHKYGIMAFRPQLTKSETLHVSPLIVKGFGADFDGDAMNYHVPSTDRSTQEAYDRMLPSRNLISMNDFKSVVHAPANEYIGGLYHATSSRSERPLKIFHNVGDMKKAYERGDVDVEDRVRILKK